MKTNEFVDWMKEMNEVFENEFGEMVCQNCSEFHSACAGNVKCECCMACQENRNAENE